MASVVGRGLAVPDLDGVLATLEELGCSWAEPPPRDGRRVVVLDDPDGHTLELVPAA